MLTVHGLLIQTLYVIGNTCDIKSVDDILASLNVLEEKQAIRVNYFEQL